MSEDGSAARARQLIADLMTGPAEALPGLPGLAVPPAPAAEVVAAARRVLHGHSDAVEERPVPPVALLPLAAALVVDEHPSARCWSRQERAEVLGWVAVLIERQGEDGVQRLLAELLPDRA
ncbi:hypothetical protein ACFYNO_40625 [Kitasatospora sp. NPDC006697]|uniref:hypothetical protein n=1 Tax=Kitasatospora sp. NPDC006697 TaxID=3364020 RepID=UPI0036C82037